MIRILSFIIRKALVTTSSDHPQALTTIVYDDSRFAYQIMVGLSVSCDWPGTAAQIH